MIVEGLAHDSSLLTRPMGSSMRFGLFSAAVMRVGVEMSVGMTKRDYQSVAERGITNSPADKLLPSRGQVLFILVV
jgi:hypothetical protein